MTRIFRGLGVNTSKTDAKISPKGTVTNIDRVLVAEVSILERSYSRATGTSRTVVSCGAAFAASGGVFATRGARLVEKVWIIGAASRSENGDQEQQ
jgi:hypothetical protein